MMWSVRKGNHLYVYHNGELVYKKNYIPGRPSVLFNIHWPNVTILPTKKLASPNSEGLGR